jgi:GT2 family glycosyltransferase
VKKLSVVVATHARPAALNRLLAGMAPQFDFNRHELFVAENGTPSPLKLRCSLPLDHLHCIRAGKCRIQNRAIAKSVGEILVFLDDDLVVGADYLKGVERFFDQRDEFAAMKGRILPAEDPETKAGPLAPYLDLPLVDHGDEVIEVRGVLGANMAFRRSVIERVGSFDERLGPGAAGHEEETEMSQRIRRAGLRIGYAPDAVVYHEVDPERASRERFIRVARERGYCRTLHERHTRLSGSSAMLVAQVRLFAARIMGANLGRIAREERRLAVARGVMDGVRAKGQISRH